jgi:uncharacterized protein YybS (DUF2232 family)
MFLAIYVATMGSEGGLLKITQDAFDGVSGQAITMMTQNGQAVTPEMTLKLHQYLAVTARVAPALGMCAWFFSTMIALIVSQSLLCYQKWNLRPAFTLTDLRLPVWVLALTLAALAAAWFAPAPYDYVGFNLAIVLGIPFFLTGLAVVHGLAASTGKPNLILIIFYIIISVIIYLVPLVALIGVVDQWVDFRKRLADRAQIKTTNL